MSSSSSSPPSGITNSMHSYVEDDLNTALTDEDKATGDEDQTSVDENGSSSEEESEDEKERQPSSIVVKSTSKKKKLSDEVSVTVQKRSSPVKPSLSKSFQRQRSTTTSQSTGTLLQRFAIWCNDSRYYYALQLGFLVLLARFIFVFLFPTLEYLNFSVLQLDQYLMASSVLTGATGFALILYFISWANSNISGNVKILQKDDDMAVVTYLIFTVVIYSYLSGLMSFISHAAPGTSVSSLVSGSDLYIKWISLINFNILVYMVDVCLFFHTVRIQYLKTLA